ncbi:MAG: hypothetical protein AAFN43_01955 [Pseudomonadota bacterium]
MSWGLIAIGIVAVALYAFGLTGMAGFTAETRKSILTKTLILSVLVILLFLVLFEQ